MNVDKLKELLAEFSLENTERPLSEVGVIEFSQWYALRESAQRLMRSWDTYEESNRAELTENQRD